MSEATEDERVADMCRRIAARCADLKRLMEAEVALEREVRAEIRKRRAEAPGGAA